MRTKGSKNKTKEIKVEVVEIVEVKVEVPKEPKVGRLTSDFGREDLNQLRDKVNEILDLIDPL